MSELLSISSRHEQPNTQVVVATGEIDVSNCEMLADAIENLNGAHDVVVDLTLCTFFDSSCLSVLVRHVNKAEENGTTFRVRANSEGRRLIDLTNLSEKLGLEHASEPVGG